MQNHSEQRWDIFCRIVDNFGDIGVCWRLSQQLANAHQLPIRLFIDDPETAQKIIPGYQPELGPQTINRVEICSWPNACDAIQPADIVLETFSCGIPQPYLSMMQPHTVWVNLEYLSAEKWIDDFHALPSPQANGLVRYFFFPGFTETTGGLIREHDIVLRNQHLPNETLLLSTLHLANLPEHALKISLFGYPNAPIDDFLHILQISQQDSVVYVPNSSILPQVAHFLGVTQTSVNATYQRGKLHIKILPFLSQDDYDSLLANCDINFVRGEDSWVRAIWAGKPFIWQPYFQSENTHMVKLNAFLSRFYGDCDEATKQAIFELDCAWTQGTITAALWQNYIQQHALIRACTHARTMALAKQPDLASKLVIYLQKICVQV